MSSASATSRKKLQQQLQLKEAALAGASPLKAAQLKKDLARLHSLLVINEQRP